MDLIGLKDYAKRKGVSVYFLRKCAREGMPHYRIGKRKILVNPQEADAWFDENFKVKDPTSPIDLDEVVRDALSRVRS